VSRKKKVEEKYRDRERTTRGERWSQSIGFEKVTTLSEKRKKLRERSPQQKKYLGGGGGAKKTKKKNPNPKNPKHKIQQLVIEIRGGANIQTNRKRGGVGKKKNKKNKKTN